MAKILSKEMFKMAIAINKNILQAFYTIYNQQKIEDYVYLENEQEFQIYLKQPLSYILQILKLLKYSLNRNQDELEKFLKVTIIDRIN